MNLEATYTSTGSKLYYWPDRLLEFKTQMRTRPISTHISPEGSCNLKCAYCSVTKREKSVRINLDVLKGYLSTLQVNGLEAVTITGGGEPCLYPQIVELIEYIQGLKLECALITNGTLLGNIPAVLLREMAWVRISLDKNYFDRLQIPEFLGMHTTLGFSYIYPGDMTSEEFTKTLQELSRIRQTHSAEYVRILPNCLKSGDDLMWDHMFIDDHLEDFEDKAIFHQGKMHHIPPESLMTCPMGYFRPYLSEQINHKGYPGTIYPCDSVVLNDLTGRFDPKYAIGAADEIQDYIDGKIDPKFKPSVDCNGCVFTRNLKVIKDYCEGARHSKFV